MTNGERIFEARVLDETAALHVDEFCTRVCVERQWIVELVELGALEPRVGSDPTAWAFAAADVPRVRTITRLVDDLGVNLPGAALIVELLEERRQLLAKLSRWESG